MNITPTDLVPVVKALINLGALTVGDKDQPATWAAYLAAEVPHAQPADLGEALRVTLRWHSEKGSYGHVNAADFAQAVHHVASKRPRPHCPHHPTENADICLPCRQNSSIAQIERIERTA